MKQAVKDIILEGLSKQEASLKREKAQKPRFAAVYEADIQLVNEARAAIIATPADAETNNQEQKTTRPQPGRA